MASKAERALVTGTDNVYDLAKYRAGKIVEQYRDEFPWVELSDQSVHDIEDRYEPIKGKCLRGWFDDKHNYLDHHRRMTEATKRMRARQEFINGHSTDS